ncbi:unnamed protein product [Ectocarpus sp. 4 AP-2014]
MGNAEGVLPFLCGLKLVLVLLLCFLVETFALVVPSLPPSLQTPLAEVEVLITIPAASAAFSSGWRGWEVGSTSTWEWGISTLGWTLFQIVVWRLLKKMSIDVAAIRAFLEANELRAQGQGVMEPAHPPGGPQNARPIRAAGNVMQEAAVEAPAPPGPQNAGRFTWLTDPFGTAFNDLGGAALYDMAETPDGPRNARWFTPWTVDPFGVGFNDLGAAPHNTGVPQ